MKSSALFLFLAAFWASFSAANESCPHFLSENGIGICQEPQTVTPDDADPVRAMTKHITKVTAWRLPMASEKKPLWQKDIPSAPGEFYSSPPFKPSFLRMQKPSNGVYPGSRYYDLEHGQFLMAATIAPAMAEGCLAGIEIWASFLQPNDYAAPDPLVARISYATPSHLLAIVGLHGSIVKAPFDVFHPAITLTAQRISVVFPAESGGQTGNIQIPVKNAVLDLEHAVVPVGYNLVPINLKSNGEDLAYDDAPDQEALGKALTLKTLRITDVDHKPLLAKIGEFKNLEVLEINCLESLQAIPEQIGEIKHLKTLNIDNGNGCAMNPQLPESLGQLSELKTLILYGAQDGMSGGHSVKRTLPKSLAGLLHLELLNLGRNEYGTVPDVVATIRGLKTLDVSFNDLTDLPESLAHLPNLSKVILDGNYTITCSKAKQADLVRRFPRITFDFQNEYDCSDEPEK